MYVQGNPKTKKSIKEAIANGQKLTVFQPNDMFNTVIPDNGTVTIEGPHYPQPHKWYAQAKLENGVIVAIK